MAPLPTILLLPSKTKNNGAHVNDNVGSLTNANLVKENSMATLVGFNRLIAAEDRLEGDPGLGGNFSLNLYSCHKEVFKGGGRAAKKYDTREMAVTALTSLYSTPLLTCRSSGGGPALVTSSLWPVYVDGPGKTSHFDRIVILTHERHYRRSE